MTDLGRRIARRLGDATFERVAAVGAENASTNRPRIGQSLLELAQPPLGKGDTAIVIGAGPSLHRRRSLERLAATGYSGAVVAVDGALGVCLRQGIVPLLIVTVDPHPERVVRWFGDAGVTAPSGDVCLRRVGREPRGAR